MQHCHSSESLVLFESAVDVASLPLPWPDEDFEMGIQRSPRLTLDGAQDHGSTFAVLAKALTLWYGAIPSLLF